MLDLTMTFQIASVILDLCLFARILAIDQQRHACYYLGKPFCVTLANLGSPTLLKYSPTSQKKDMLRDIGRPCVVFAEYREHFSLGFPFRFVFSFLLHSLSIHISQCCCLHVSRGVQYCSSCSVFFAMRRLLNVCCIDQKQLDKGN